MVLGITIHQYPKRLPCLRLCAYTTQYTIFKRQGPLKIVQRFLRASHRRVNAIRCPSSLEMTCGSCCSESLSYSLFESTLYRLCLLLGNSFPRHLMNPSLTVLKCPGGITQFIVATHPKHQHSFFIPSSTFSFIEFISISRTMLCQMTFSYNTAPVVHWDTSDFSPWTWVSLYHVFSRVYGKWL